MIEVINLHKSFDAGGGTVEALRGYVPTPSRVVHLHRRPVGLGEHAAVPDRPLDRPTSGTIRVGSRNVTAMTDSEQDAYRRGGSGSSTSRST